MPALVPQHRSARLGQVFACPIVTTVVPLPASYTAKACHQNHVALNPAQPYVVFNDLPKLAHLREQFAELYRSK